jgi:phage major head subunit gpT-like protein
MVPDVFTQLLRSEFLAAQQQIYTQPPLPPERFMTTIPSTGRMETYLLGSMPASMQPYKGTREYQKFNADPYQVLNEPFYNAFEAMKDDVADDKVQFYPNQARMLVEKAKQFPADLGLKKLCLLGTTDACFDKSAFFATSHNVGTVKGSIGAGQGGGNIVNFTSAASDGATFKLIFIMNNGFSGIKPVLLQEREALSELQTDQGTPQAEERRSYRYWIDARWGVGFGFWWDAILVNITNTPTLTELQTVFERVVTRFRQFRLPVGNASDPPRGVHDNAQFTPDTCTILTTGRLEVAMGSIVGNETIVNSGGAVTNYFKGKGTVLFSAYLDE